ncbi:MAG: hypothetical protein PF447_01995 [Spirochaetaceae bacterium]|jgi:glucosylceramidase|nr:hypothetical protein [Spirochaetaceae bacterium]
MNNPKKSFRCLVLLALIVLAALSSCASKSLPVEIWMTRADESVLLERQGDVFFTRGPRESSALTINENERYQLIDGFGASFTESSGYAISFLPQDKQDQLMLQLFDREAGIGISFLRQPMGSPDFALSTYSYDDLEPGEEDFELEKFSIEGDQQYIIPYLQQALEINPQLKIMASPWSPPAWMKMGNSMIGAEGGQLREDCYEVYAQYFVRFIQAYQSEGIPVYAVTIQNEVNYAPSSYSGMVLTPREEALFIGSYLGPALEEADLHVKILCYDHNWDRPDLAIQTLSDPTASPYIAGSAWHYYGGTAGVMSHVKEQFPDKDIWFTEGSMGNWIGHGSFSANFIYSMNQGIDIMNNWSKSIIWWNIALDESNGPIVFDNSANFGLVQIDTAGGTQVFPNRPSWYSLGHFSKFIQQGAVAVASEDPAQKIQSAAIINPDDSRVLVLFNKYYSEITQVVLWNNMSLTLVLPANSAITCVWAEE